MSFNKRYFTYLVYHTLRSCTCMTHVSHNLKFPAQILKSRSPKIRVLFLGTGCIKYRCFNSTAKPPNLIFFKSSFSFNHLGSKMVGMFLEIVFIPMIVAIAVAKGFVRRCFVARISVRIYFRGTRTYWCVSARRSAAMPNKIVRYEHSNYPKEHTNFYPRFEPKQKLDIVEKQNQNLKFACTPLDMGVLKPHS